MRAFFPTALALVAGLACSSGPPPNAFWSDAWGEPPASLAGSLREVEPDGRSRPTHRTCYARAEDEAVLLGVPVDAVRYCFYDAQLFAIDASVGDPATAGVLYERFCEEIGAEPQGALQGICEVSRGGVRATASHRGGRARVDRVHEELSEAYFREQIDEEREGAIERLMRD